ncbi:Uu.00g127150.m01.CDS01 [Anthostomella pinea]|uniref:tyrosinase n=1 Tax=Anthostomella pinea TaxID=933095 RepID=A0AAI8VIS7_9PEZI|nr:Uu.00g127150.m01.CDS01 [Anthostomella pinea]
MVLAGKLVFYAAVATWKTPVHGQDAPVPVTGLTTGINAQTGERPARLNINLLEAKGGPTWDLFIRGLDAMQNKLEDDVRSHFAVGGIHGMPFRPYNSVDAVTNGSGMGYCPHMQALGLEVQRIASEYTDDAAPAYLAAAQILRLPYWDWATDPTLPSSSTLENITVNGPKGPLELHNPLYNYRWQTYPLNQSQFPGYGSFGPVTTRDGSGGFDPDYVNSDLQNATDRIKDSVYRTFASTTTYDQMASMANYGSSFEAAHNDIHNLVGGSFPNLAITSFDSLLYATPDPVLNSTADEVFLHSMLHHCNLDRLAALWTSVHPNETHQTQPYSSDGLYSTAKGETITADSPLKPFYQADGKTFHTGMTVISTDSLGYTYPEMRSGHLPVDQDESRKNSIVQINRLYSPGTTTATAAARVKRDTNPGRQWVIAVQVERSELDLPCSIDIYLGAHLAGRTVLLGMPDRGLAYDQISLQRAIGALDISGQDPAAVEQALEKQLRVEVSKGDGKGTMIDPSSIPSLKLDVVAEDVTPPGAESELPRYSNQSVLAGVFAQYKGKGEGRTDRNTGGRWWRRRPRARS